MQGQIEVRIEPSNESAWEVYFWENGRRSQCLNLYGPVDEYFLEGNPVPESIFAWVKLTIERQEIGKNKIVWGVTYKTNVVDNDLHMALERVKKNIETALQRGMPERIVLNDDLKLSEWETALPKTES